jgi:ubiquitin fusion degradation protein 1
MFIGVCLQMMRYLLLDEGDLLQVESASLPVATFSKFQPQSPDFLDITNPKAVLENALRNFACLTSGDVIAITYNDRVYELCVLETKPEDAVSIIECDMNVEFAAPVGYSEPEWKPAEKEPEEAMDTFDPSQFVPEPQGFVAFSGQGVRSVIIYIQLTFKSFKILFLFLKIGWKAAENRK